MPTFTDGAAFIFGILLVLSSGFTGNMLTYARGWARLVILGFNLVILFGGVALILEGGGMWK